MWRLWIPFLLVLYFVPSARGLDEKQETILKKAIGTISVGYRVPQTLNDLRKHGIFEDLEARLLLIIALRSRMEDNHLIRHTPSLLGIPQGLAALDVWDPKIESHFVLGLVWQLREESKYPHHQPSETFKRALQAFLELPTFGQESWQRLIGLMQNCANHHVRLTLVDALLKRFDSHPQERDVAFRLIEGNALLAWLEQSILRTEGVAENTGDPTEHHFAIRVRDHFLQICDQVEAQYRPFLHSIDGLEIALEVLPHLPFVSGGTLRVLLEGMQSASLVADPRVQSIVRRTLPRLVGQVSSSTQVNCVLWLLTFSPDDALRDN